MARSRPPSVAEEIGQTAPFRTSSQEAVVALLRTADDVRHLFAAQVETEGITIQQYNVLRILRGAGAAGLPTLTIGERMIERQPGVTRLVDRLIRKRLVQRRRGVEDRRQVLCTLTPEGRALLAGLDERIRETDEILGSVLGSARLEALIGLLDTIRAGVREAAPDEATAAAS